MVVFFGTTVRMHERSGRVRPVRVMSSSVWALFDPLEGDEVAGHRQAGAAQSQVAHHHVDRGARRLSGLELELLHLHLSLAGQEHARRRSDRDAHQRHPHQQLDEGEAGAISWPGLQYRSS